jgi:hypothetical protein
MIASLVAQILGIQSQPMAAPAVIGLVMEPHWAVALQAQLPATKDQVTEDRTGMGRAAQKQMAEIPSALNLETERWWQAGRKVEIQFLDGRTAKVPVGQNRESETRMMGLRAATRPSVGRQAV